MRAGFWMAAVLAAMAAVSSAGVREAFENPPDSARLQVWYHWNGDCVTREGIVRDFAALGKLGVSQVCIIAPQMANLPVTAPTMSDEWLRLFEFAIAEAKRNGFTLGFHNCPGWSSSGGPWIRPENAMKVVVSSECDVTVGGESAVTLPQPLTNNGFYRDIATYALPLESPAFRICDAPVRIPLRAEGSEHVITAESRETLSPTCAVLAFRQASFHADGTIEASADGRRWRKVGEFAFRFFKAPALPKLVRLTGAEGVRFFRVTFRHAPPLPWVPAADLDLLRCEVNSLPMIADIERYNGIAPDPDRRTVPPVPGSCIAPEDVVDLSSRVATDGRLSLVGAGLKTGRAYRIVRIGYTSKGVGPAPSSTGGLECDKLSRAGIEAHWVGMPARILALKGARGTVAETFIDSYEVGGQNWSECLPDEFARRCGYPIGANLLTVCGYCLKDAGTATRFLWDCKRTIGELFAENYYDRFAGLCRAAGIRSCAQTYGGPFDDLRAARHIDRPQGEFWMHGKDCGGSVRRMASAVHLYGKGIASAESFTSEEKEGRWLASPHAFRTVGDRYGWLAGANQLVAHIYCHQPFTNAVPGISLGRHGSHFTVNSTWWKEGPVWHDYVRRGQAMLQYGKPGADILVLSARVQDALTDAGYEYDLASESDLDCLEVRGGRIGVPGKSAYAALVVASDVEARLTSATRARLEALSAAGARVLRGRALETVRKAGLVPSFVEPTGALRGIHRVGDGKEVVWFVVNVGTNGFAGSVELTSAPGLVPERYDAKTGEISALPFVERTQGRCAVELALRPGESAFVVLSPGRKTDVPPPAREVGRMDLSQGWTIVRFEGLNAPSAPLRMPSLADWTASSDEKLAWFSGRALYERDVDLPAAWATDTSCRELVLDLGSVHEIANVFVNGCPIGCLWESPYRMCIPVERISRRFRLGVEVVNLLPNRLIGDACARARGCAEEKGTCGVPKWVLEGRRDSGTGIYTWSNFQHGWLATDRPLPSGLLGPVTLTLSEACIGSDIDAGSLEKRRTAIRESSDLKFPGHSVCRYLSARTGDDNADGQSPKSAWRTLARLAKEELPPGTIVRFERGGVYRGTVRTCSGCTYAAYGEGPKPCIYGSPEDGADPAKWTQTDDTNVWAYDIGHDDVGSVVFDGGAAHAVKVLIRIDEKTGRKTDQRTGLPFNSHRDLRRDLDFWHDYYKNGTGLLYLCSETNPGARFKSIEFNVKRHGVAIGTNANVTVDNLCIKYVGAHGVGAGTCRNLTVSNCEFAWIGGSIQKEKGYRRDYPTRFGNAVEIWGGCDGFVVTNCLISQVYDAGITHQYEVRAKAGATRYDQKNILYADNVIERCNYSFEWFLKAPRENRSRMENVLVRDNICLDAGFGFCEERPDKGGAAHVKSWGGPGANRAVNCEIRDNVFGRSKNKVLDMGVGFVVKERE